MTSSSMCRLGGNYLTLPINQARNKHHDNHYDGLMNTVKRTEEIDYFPSRNNQTVGYVLLAYML